MFSFQNRIDNKWFSWAIFSDTFTKNTIVLCNSNSTTKFKIRSFRIGLNFLTQAKIISMNTIFINRMVINIILLIY